VPASLFVSARRAVQRIGSKIPRLPVSEDPQRTHEGHTLGPTYAEMVEKGYVVMTCKHEWTTHPLPQAEFKCIKCAALGHWEGNRLEILPYSCQRLGCDEDAVEVVNAVRLCIEHRNQAKKASGSGKR